MESVKLIECPRDAWQGLPGIIPSARKVEYLRALIAAGFRHVDAVSFVSPKAIPQMADSEEVLRELGPQNGVEIIGIVVNEKGAERALATKAVTTLGFPSSISETFLQRNQNQSREENEAVLEKICACAKDSNLKMVAYISMAFGNPYRDAWNENAIAQAAKKLEAMGVQSISLADTIGAADADLIRRVVSAVLEDCRKCEIGVHLHSTYEDAVTKILAAYDAGCRRFDSAMGGLGGCPFAQDELIGNIPTERVLEALKTRGIDLPISNALENIAELNHAISNEFSGSLG